jgi:hypothetical protein
MRPTEKSLRKHTPTKMVGNRNWSKRHPDGKHKPKAAK